jgi:hypothetical protein
LWWSIIAIRLHKLLLSHLSGVAVSGSRSLLVLDEGKSVTAVACELDLVPSALGAEAVPERRVAGYPDYGSQQYVDK